VRTGGWLIFRREADKDRAVLLRLLTLLVLLAPQLAQAEIVRTDRVTARLVPEVAQAAPGETVWVGLHLDIAEGWHTYWRNPGDSGQATALDWTLPQGIVAGDIVWPHPEALPFGPLVNYGYEDEALHLVPITLPEDWPLGRPVRLEAAARWLVCADICVPEDGTVALTVPTGPVTEPDPTAGSLFQRFRARVPEPPGFDVAATNGARLELVVDRPLARGAEAHFFPARPGVIEPAAEQRLRRGPESFTLGLEAKADASPARLAGVLVVSERFGPQTFTEAFAVAPELTAAPTAARPPPTLLTAVALALAGGVLLNLMPCVFPVLSMKALALVQTGAAARGRARVEGIAYTAGVLVTFLAVGGALVAARLAGAQVGWGFQLQSPLVVAALAYLLFAIGLNLSGLFAVAGPAGAGGGLVRDGASGAFFTGALAVVVATPCTAPFMATALGFALVQPPPVTLAVFAALGLGLALPFLLVSLVPALARRLPRPGPWMVRLRQGLAFPMYASAAWLVWVLARQAGPDAVLAVLAGATLLAFGLWLAAPAERRPHRASRAVGIVAAVAALALLAVPAVLRTDAVAAETAAAGEAWTVERLDAARGEGGPVLVNMTAAWCLTCKVNEQVALSGARFDALLARTGTTYLVGDWTNRDATISAFIDRFAHPGVPLYVVYPADGGAPEVLPQVLTPRTIAHALEAAAAGA
jgi:thiol:disulfide interchange protein DsbD